MFYLFNLFLKVNSKWIKDLNVRPDTIKLLEENISRTHSDINHSNIFFDQPPKVMKRKAKINKCDLIKFCTTKEIINKTKDNPENGREHLHINRLTND